MLKHLQHNNAYSSTYNDDAPEKYSLGGQSIRPIHIIRNYILMHTHEVMGFLYIGLDTN